MARGQTFMRAPRVSSATFSSSLLNHQSKLHPLFTHEVFDLNSSIHHTIFEQKADKKSAKKQILVYQIDE